MAVGLVVLCCSTPVSLRAGEPAESFDSLSAAERSELENRVQEGLDAYDRRNYEASLREFQAALDILEHPDFVYRVALAYERLGRNRRAVEHYRQFLEMAPHSDDGPEVEQTIRRLQRKIERSEPTVEVRSDPAGARVRLKESNERIGTTALETTLEPGEHTLVVSKEGYETIERDIEVEAGKSMALQYALRPVDAASESASGGTPTGSLLLMGAGGLAAAGTVGSYLQFNRYRNVVRRQQRCTPDCTEPSTFDANVRDQKTWEAITWGSGALAVGTLAGGALWAALAGGSDTRSARSAPSVRVIPTLTGQFVGVVYKFRPLRR